MCFRIPSWLLVCGFVCGILSPSELLAQSLYYWNRTNQVSHTGGSTSCPGDYATGTSGYSSADTVAAAAEAGGSDEEGNSGFAHTDAIGELNLDEQAALSWSFIHNQYYSVQASPNDSYTGLVVTQGTSVDTSAVLEEDVPGEGTVAELIVNIGWSSGKSNVWQKSAGINISFGNANLTIYGDGGLWGDFQAFGTDGDGIGVFKTSTAPVGSTTGSLAFGPGEFTANVQAGSGAQIVGSVASRVSEYMIAAGTQDSDAEIFQGVITINVE